MIYLLWSAARTTIDIVAITISVNSQVYPVTYKEIRVDDGKGLLSKNTAHR